MNDLKGIIEDCNKSDLVSDKIIKKVIEIIGQEEWQDLHDENNDICTTMGELIITLKGIAELEHQLTHRNCLDCSNHSSKLRMRTLELEKENAELKSIAEFQQSSNMSRHFENKKLKEGLAVGSMWNKHLNSQNKALEEERDKYRDMTFEQREQLTKAKELLKKVLDLKKVVTKAEEYLLLEEAEQFLNSEVEK